MTDTYSALDYTDPEEALASVEIVINKHHLTSLFDGLFAEALRSWCRELSKQATSESCPDEVTPQLLNILDKWCRHSSPSDKNLHNLYKTLWDECPQAFEEHTDKYAESLGDIESSGITPDKWRLYGLYNGFLARRPFNKDWIKDYLGLGTTIVLPVFKGRDPEKLGQLLSGMEEEDIVLIYEIEKHIFDPACPRSKGLKLNDFTEKFGKGLSKKLFQDEDPVERCIDLLSKLIVAESKFNPSLNEKIAEAILWNTSLDVLNHQDFKKTHAAALIYCADITKCWLKLEEPIRERLFDYVDTRIYDHGTSKDRYDSDFSRTICPKRIEPTIHNGLKEHLKNNTACDPRFWLLRPDAERYSSRILEASFDWNPQDSLWLYEWVLKKIGKDRPAIREQIKSAILKLFERPAQADLRALAQLLNTPTFDDLYDKEKFELILLGRLRQCLHPEFEGSLPELFERSYQAVLKRNPLDVLTRLLNAVISSEIPLSDEALNFLSPRERYFGEFRNIGTSLRHETSIPGSWVITRIIEWIVTIIPQLIRVEEGTTEPRYFSNGGALTIEMVRKKWAELCWNKLDLRKEAKKAGVTNISKDDQVEPRSSWRIAHIKCLADLGDDLGNKAHRRINKIAESDPDNLVRDTAKQAYNVVLRERQANAENPLISFLKASLWFRIANRESLGYQIDLEAAGRTRNREIRAAKEEMDWIKSSQQ